MTFIDERYPYNKNSYFPRKYIDEEELGSLKEEDFLEDNIFPMDRINKKFYVDKKNSEMLCFTLNFNEILTDDMIKEIEENNYKIIMFSLRFNKSIDKLPECVNKIVFDELSDFNKSIVKLPKYLTHLKLPSEYNKRISIFPDTITHLDLGDSNKFCIPKLPNNLKYLKIGMFYEKELPPLPLSLEILEFDRNSKFNLRLDNLPIFLVKLVLGYEYNQPINNLPSSLKILEFSEYSKFNHELDNLPIGLEVLIFRFDSKFNQPLNFLPNSLKKLVLENEYKHKLDNLPNSIIMLKLLKCDYNHNFPSSLKVLIINTCDIILENIGDNVETIDVLNIRIPSELPKKINKFYEYSVNKKLSRIS